MLLGKELHKCDFENHMPDAAQQGLKLRAVS